MRSGRNPVTRRGVKESFRSTCFCDLMDVYDFNLGGCGGTTDDPFVSLKKQ